MKKIQALKNTLCHKSIIYAALCFAVIGFQPASSYADGHGIESEWTVGLEVSFGELLADLQIDGILTIGGRVMPQQSFAPVKFKEVGGGIGAFLRYDAHFPNDWIVGAQLTVAYEGYNILRREANNTLSRAEFDAALVDILGRVGYDTHKEIRPFIAIGPTFLMSDDTAARDNFIAGLKVGVGFDLVLDAFDGHMVVSIGYLHANYFEKGLDRDGSNPALFITDGKFSAESHQGAISVGYRF